MPNKLRNTSGRISFFAFQDMITTVTGVLLLITLLLTFYLNQPEAAAEDNATRAAREQLAGAQAKLKASLVALHAQQLQPLAATNQVFVIPEPDPSGKQPVLIVLSNTNGWCDKLGQNHPVEFEARADHADFLRLLDSWEPQQQRLVFYIRPSGIAQFDACRKLAAARGFSYGYDAAEENREYLLTAP